MGKSDFPEARSAYPDEKCPLERPDPNFGQKTPLERPNPRFWTEFQNLLEVVVDSDRFGSFPCGQASRIWDTTFWGDVRGPDVLWLRNLEYRLLVGV